MNKTYTISEAERAALSTILADAYEDSHVVGQDPDPAILELGMMFSMPHTEPKPPLWKQPVFTDLERVTIFSITREEIRDSVDYQATNYLDSITADSHPDEICELYGHVDPDTELSALILTHWADAYSKVFDPYPSSDILNCLSFLRRFSLVAMDNDKNRVVPTLLGILYRGVYS